MLKTFLIFFSTLLLLVDYAHANETIPETRAKSDVSCDISQRDICYSKALDLHYGKNGPKDKTAAHKIFADLCEAKMSKACHAAAMAISRYSENPDFEKAMYFQKLGCDTGTARSCFVLGRSHEAPWKTDMKADHEKAKIYFERACDLGMGLACGYAEVEATGYRLK